MLPMNCCFEEQYKTFQESPQGCTWMDVSQCQKKIFIVYNPLNMASFFGPSNKITISFYWWKRSELALETSKDAAYLEITYHLSDGGKSFLVAPFIDESILNKIRTFYFKASFSPTLKLSQCIKCGVISSSSLEINSLELQISMLI